MGVLDWAGYKSFFTHSGDPLSPQSKPSQPSASAETAGATQRLSVDQSDHGEPVEKTSFGERLLDPSPAKHDFGSGCGAHQTSEQNSSRLSVLEKDRRIKGNGTSDGDSETTKARQQQHAGSAVLNAERVAELVKLLQQLNIRYCDDD